MKRILFLSALVLTIGANAQDFPAPSPKAKVYQMVGLTEVEVEYSSPGKRDRKIWGGVVPYNEIWRTGANMATKITFSDSVKIGNDVVEAGTYAIFTNPADQSIQFIFNSDWNQGGTGNYEKSLDVARIKVPFNETKTTTERMRFTIENTTTDAADLVLTWGNKKAEVPMTFFTDAKVAENFEAKKKEFEREYALYSDGANYYLDAGDLKRAREMAEKSVSMEEKFWNLHTLAKIYKDQGEKKLAMQTAEKSLKLAREADYQPYVRMNEKLISELK
ncbi:MAG TPA: DUF2911 domain-containing protein [Cryomorphaceae bacterium]|nr:DUF2911 domain-containing protein [Cryomorphaceae bacterium]